LAIRKHFDYKQLKNFTFGKLDGELDLDVLNDSFISTNSVSKFLDMKFNYVLSPRGSGKTALYKSLENKIINNRDFNYDKYFMVFIDQAFGQLDENLIEDNFKMPRDYRNAIFSWALYLVYKILDKIFDEGKKKEKKELNNIDGLFKELKIYDEIKEKYQSNKLNKILDIVKVLNLRLKLNIKGQQLEIGPPIENNEIKNNLDINSLFAKINSFFKDNNKRLVVIIDRLDSFVKREKYKIQKKYIQGLLDTVEELTTYSSLHVIVLLRTDLFYSLDLAMEYDKTKDRVLNLEWQKHEILEFIVKRFLKNQYIKRNFGDYLGKFQRHEIYKRMNENGKKINIINKAIIKLFKKSKDFGLDQNLYYSVYERFIKLFLPHKVIHYNKKWQKDDMELCRWLFMHFKYQNDIINPRVIISFFNTLFLQQYEEYCNDVTKTVNDNCLLFEPTKVNDFLCLNIFTKDIICSAYEKTRNEELKNIYMILNVNEKNLFREIIAKSYKTGEYKKDLCDYKKYNITIQNYNRFLKYLVILGFFKLKSGSSTEYTLPFIFRRDINFENDM